LSRPAFVTLGNLIAAGLAPPAARHYSPAMTDSRSSRFLCIATVALAGMALPTGSAVADDSSTQKTVLPGVSSDYRIAKPAPEPEPNDALPASGNGQFEIGDTDVRISGSITVDVAAGATKPSNR
jgi:hypothetical protein